MKASRYNYVVPFGEKKIFFNGLTEAFFLVSPEYEDDYRRLIESPDDNGEWADSFLKRMKNAGFIVDDDTDELELVKDKFEALRRNDMYYLMVLPTYQCNLRCWYCLQDHESMFMDDEVLERIKRLIERKMSDESIKRLHLSWFGGEPLMAYDKVRGLTSFAKDYAEKHDKIFTCAITTNGTLLNAERIDELHSLGVGHYQITIDGDRTTHNSIKHLGTISAYDRTLDNINMIARHTSVSLRFNYSRENLKPDQIFSTLLEKLDSDVRKNITFSIFKVWQQDQEEINGKDVDKLFINGIQAGMFSTVSVSGICYVDQMHFDCIFPNGRVGKCDNQSPKGMPGLLQKDGVIVWQEDVEIFNSPHIFDDLQKICYSCGYLPICWGPCQHKRELMLKKHGVIKCKYKNPDDDMEASIINMCKTKLQRTE